MHKTDANERPIDIRIRGLEQRPLVGDPKSYVRHLVDAGFNVSTIGAMNGLGFSGYPTDHLPPVQDMDPHWISGVLKEAHAHNIKLICWNVFNIQDVRNVDDFQIAKRYPQWEMQYLDVPGVEYGPRKGMCMLSSPYLEQHAKLIQEVAGLGVDAMWFDGFYLGGIPHPIRPGCVCSFCRERFRSDYELDLPTRVDWENPAFKRWIRWRNERLMSGARFMTEKIHEVRPSLPVTFNYNQWPFGTKDWPNAIPLWNTGDYGVSQHAYSPDEAMQWVMLGYKSQLSHDLNPDYSDIWRTGNPIFDLDEGNTDHVAKHELQIALFTLTALTFGTIPWRSHHQFADVQRRNNELLAAREPYFRKRRLTNVGVVLSQNTHDFWGHIPGTDNLTSYRDGILGTWLLLTEHSIPFSFVFDNQINPRDLSAYSAIVLPDTACLSDGQIEVLDTWATSGGVLIATGATGVCDEWGERRRTTALSDRVLHTRFEENPGRLYAYNRFDTNGPKLVKTLSGFAPYRVEAPAYVVVNAFANTDGSCIIHVLNASAFYGFENGCGFTGVEGSGLSGRDIGSDADLAARTEKRNAGFATRPVENIEITFTEHTLRSAESALTGRDYGVRNGRTISIPYVDLHETIIVTCSA